MIPALDTPRLTLRELRPDDYEAVHAYASDPEVVQYMTWGPNTPQDTRDFLDRAAASSAAEPRLGYELAVVPKGGDRLVGAVGLHVGEGGEQAMVGYCYHRDAWGRGYATEAATALLAFAFDVLHLHRVWAACDPDNVGSARVLEKIGMTLEGRLREDTRIRGEFRDTLVFGILDREWHRTEADR